MVVFDQGIAVTSHASQGKTVDQIIVSVQLSAFSQANQAQFYVSMSRARVAMHFYSDSKLALKEAVMRPSQRLSPAELIEDSETGAENGAVGAMKSRVQSLKDMYGKPNCWEKSTAPLVRFWTGSGECWAFPSSPS